MSAICKSCGREYREGRQCPEHGGETVCVSCCKKCSYHRERDYGNLCEWYRYNKKIDYDAEIKKLDLQINALRQKVRYYYERSWTDSARKKEHEVEMLLRLKRRMMEERDNERRNKDTSDYSKPSDNNTDFYGTGDPGRS
ncbi:MAG: hypothetical protein MR908_00675 [Firmicutes bacterium]|nr:hypothetical protein [Bacillota bacterium]